MMVYDIRPLVRENFLERYRISDIGFIKICLRIYIFPRTTRKIVDDGDFMSRRDVGVGYVRCDESRSAGYDYFHNSYFGFTKNDFSVFAMIARSRMSERFFK